MSTAQNDFVPASIGRRVLAFIIDSTIVSMLWNFVIVLVAVVLLLIFGVPDEKLLEDSVWQTQVMGTKYLIFIILGVVLFILLMAGIWHLYFVYFEHMYRKTPGKKALSLFVVSTNGKDLSFKQVIMREVFRCYVDMLFIIPGFLCMLLTKNNQRIGDLATDTLVLYSPRLEAEAGYLYLSRDQYELRATKYRVNDSSLDEANRFLIEAKVLLMGQSMSLGVVDEFLAKVLVIEDSTFEDTLEMRVRFVAEYLLQVRRAA